MQSNIALLLCIFFIFTIFLKDIKKKSNVSLAIWVPLTWMLICGSRAVALWLDTGSLIATEIDYVSGNPIDRTILTALMIIGIIILARRRIEWSKIISNNIWLFALLIFMGFSILWSEIPTVSFKRWVRTIGSLIMVLVVLTDPDPVEAVKRMFKRCAYILIPLSILFIKYYRNLGVGYTYDGLSEMWVGVTTHKNGLGQLCLTCGFFFLWNIWSMYRTKEVSVDKKELFIYLLLLLMIFWMLNGSPTSRSVTSNVCFVIGISVLILLNMLESNPQYIGRVLFTIVFMALIIQLAVTAILDESLTAMFVKSIDRDITLTGRTDLWDDLIAIASQNPFLGTGYGSFWIGDVTHNLWDKYAWKPEQAHNGYIDVYVELGLVGLSLLMGFIYSAYKNTKKILLCNFDYGVFRMAFLIIILFYNLSESTFAKAYNLQWFIFLLIAVYIPPKIPTTNQKPSLKNS